MPKPRVLERAAVTGKETTGRMEGSPGPELSASDTCNGWPLSLPVMQLKWWGGVPSGKPCSHSSEPPVHQALLQLAARELGWMRSERPMVWCCFFLRAQVSSLLFRSRGMGALSSHPSLHWVSDPEVWEGVEVLSLPKLIGSELLLKSNKQTNIQL